MEVGLREAVPFSRRREGEAGYLDAAQSSRTDENGTSCTILNNKGSLTQEAGSPASEVVTAAREYVGN